MGKKKIGQITVKRIGNKWAACISGTPQELYNSFKLAESHSERIREKHGWRHYRYKKKKR